MNIFYKIAQFIDQYSNHTKSLEYQIYDTHSKWIGLHPNQVKQERMNKNSIFDKIQKFEFVNLTISGDHFLEKTYNNDSADYEQNFVQQFSTFSTQNALVNCYEINSDTSIAIFLPKFKLEPVIKELDENFIKISSIKISSSTTDNKNCIFQLIPNDITRNNEDRIYFSSFRKILFLGIIFSVILTSVLFLGVNLSEKIKNQHLSQNIDSNRSKNQLDSLQNVLKYQEQLIVQNSTYQKRYKYQILNEIALSTPEQITLTKLSLNPLTAKIRTDKPILFSNNTIHIKGFSDEIKSIYSWISKVNSSEWVTDIYIDEINENRENTNLTFSIIITISK